MEINKIYNENCLDTMAKMEDNFIDLTVTSPPYDNLRTYNGFEFAWEAVLKELYRTTKKGGIVVWVVGDATVKGSETGTSFRQALYAMECGFNLHDTMIYNRLAMPNASKRYGQDFEYMFVLSKGKVKTFNPIQEPCKFAGCGTSPTSRGAKGNLVGRGRRIIKDTKKKSNIWRFTAGVGKSTKDKFAHSHPAIFPEQLAERHILSWSNINDIVYDPFMGSGTTAKMAKLNNRNYVGSEISKEYCKIIVQRLNDGAFSYLC